MRGPRQFIALATLCGTIPLAAWGVASFVSSFPVVNTATTIRDRDAMTTGAIHLVPKTTDRVPSAAAMAPLAEVPKSVADSTTPNLGHVLAAGAPVIKTPVAGAPAVEAAQPAADPQRLPEASAQVAAEAASEQAPRAVRSLKDRDETTGAIPLKFAAEEATSWDFDPAPAPAPEKAVRLVSLFPSKALD